MFNKQGGEETKENSGGNGFDSDEDHDIIEVGGKNNSGLSQMMPGNSIINSGNHNSANGSTASQVTGS